MQTLEKHDDEVFKERLEVCVVQSIDAASGSLEKLIEKLARIETKPESISARDLEDIIVQSNEIRVSDVLDHPIF